MSQSGEALVGPFGLLTLSLHTGYVLLQAHESACQIPLLLSYPTDVQDELIITLAVGLRGTAIVILSQL